jgi:hypothetical protein
MREQREKEENKNPFFNPQAAALRNQMKAM